MLNASEHQTNGGGVLFFFKRVGADELSAERLDCSCWNPLQGKCLNLQINNDLYEQRSQHNVLSVP